MSTSGVPPPTSVGGGSAGSGGSELRPRTIYERDAEKTLKEKNVPIGSVHMAEKAGGAHEGDMEIETNVYPIEMQQPFTVYRYDASIVGVKQNGREAVFTKKMKDDAMIVNRRESCREAIVMFWDERKEYLGKARCFYNDLQSILYTLAPLCPLGSPAGARMSVAYEFDVNADKPGHSVFIENRIARVKMDFRPLPDGQFAVRMADLIVPAGADSVAPNRDLLQFLDIATSQEVFFRGGDGAYEHVHFSTGLSYAYSPADYGFTDQDTVTFDENKTYLALGCHKSTHVIEGHSTGPRAGRMAALLIQPKKTPFHADCNLIDKVTALLGGRLTGSQLDEAARKQVTKLTTHLKGIYVKTLHNLDYIQHFPIKSLDRRGANEATIEVGGGAMTIQQYFQEKYGYQLQYPNLPLITAQMMFGTEKRTNFYPMEVLQIMDNQRVNTHQQTPTMIQQSIRKCAIAPTIFKRQIMQTANSIHLWDGRYLEPAGISLPPKPLVIRGHQVPHPEVQTGDSSSQRPALDGGPGPVGWKINRVFVPQTVLGNEFTWAVVCFANIGPRDRNDLTNFLDMYQAQARARGIPLPELTSQVQYVNFRGANEDIARQFQQAYTNGVAFLLCIHGDADDQAHHAIKMCERDFKVISQCVKAGTVRNVVQKNQRLTVDNILLKTNVKLGGLNYSLPRSNIATDKTTLVIGFGTNHPGGGIGDRESSISGDKKSPPSESSDLSAEFSIVTGPPSVVGFAANVGPTRLPFDYVGDFMYQKPRREERANVIEAIVGKCLGYFADVRDGNLPERVILFRNGCSEGQFPFILKYEVPLIKHKLEELGCGHAKVTILVPNKLQNVRFFNKQINPGDKPPQQNIRPGLALDTAIVHPVHCEFYLNSHRTLQGSARTPKYTLLYDENNFDLRQLEQMSYHLSFGHQIINTPVSLPAPVYIANEYAKRGRNLYNQCDDLARQDLTFDMLNDRLGLSGADWISSFRVNA